MNQAHLHQEQDTRSSNQGNTRNSNQGSSNNRNSPKPTPAPNPTPTPGFSSASAHAQCRKGLSFFFFWFFNCDYASCILLEAAALGTLHNPNLRYSAQYFGSMYRGLSVARRKLPGNKAVLFLLIGLKYGNTPLVDIPSLFQSDKRHVSWPEKPYPITTKILLDHRGVCDWIRTTMPVPYQGVQHIHCEQNQYSYCKNNGHNLPLFLARLCLHLLKLRDRVEESLILAVVFLYIGKNKAYAKSAARGFVLRSSRLNLPGNPCSGGCMYACHF